MHYSHLKGLPIFHFYIITEIDKDNMQHLMMASTTAMRTKQ